ncbi:MAG TPA: hypothetical protein VKY89_07455 [Thermoanaerobaculia bacterium]|nr:hypothetical protein [Thermoanaerobaculia bacterium]
MAATTAGAISRRAAPAVATAACLATALAALATAAALGAPAAVDGDRAATAVAASDAATPAPAELDAMLAAVCGSGQVAAAGSPAHRMCRSVPAYPTPCRQSLAIDTVVTGSFTAPLAVEAVADYEGCEPHAGNFGGSVLLRRRAGGWERIAFLPGERTQTCLRFRRPDGRDALACFSTWAGQGEEDGVIVLLVLALDDGGKLATTELRRFSDVFWDSVICRRGEVGRAHTLESFAGWTRLPAGGGHPPRLQVRYRVQRFAIPSFCAAAPENPPDGDPTMARFTAWRKRHSRSAAFTLEWRAGSFARAGG